MKDETFTEIYERYAATIMKSVVARTNDEELAKEICQQTFLAYYRKMDSVKPDMVKYWLLRVAQNCLIDYWRRCGVRKEVYDDEEVNKAYRTAKAPVYVEAECVDREFICWLMAELRAENERWYDVIDCVCIQGMSHKEAAKHLGITTTVLRARLSRAKRFIRKEYNEDYFEQFE